MEFEEKFIAFVDVLGFASLVELAESGEGMTLSELLKIVDGLGSEGDKASYDEYGPTICPESEYFEKNINFQITQISDCVIVSSESSISGAINLVNHCRMVTMRLLMKGVMCRGYITRGSILHTDRHLIGSGYQEAYRKEAGVVAFKQSADELGTPFVQIDPAVVAFIEKSKDECAIKMFERFTERDEDTVAVFPFKRLSHSFGIGGIFGEFDPIKEKESNQTMRDMIIGFKEKILSFVPPENESAAEKVRHYVRALDKQLDICDQTDEIIDRLCAPFPG